ncbi:MAG: hypothetical protein JNL05_13440 [Flavobacteriales bacterium]|nr:hypothetical protein [Flavobacteriales bacterium]
MTKVLLVAFGVLLMAHGLVQFGHMVMHKAWGALTLLFDMDREDNMPTFFNCGLFFLGAVLFYLAGRSERNLPQRPWMVMTAAFLFLAIDEGAQVHEQFMLVTLRLIGWDQWHMGWLYYAWVIPYGIAAGALGIYMLRFVVKLPAATRNGLFLSGVLYVLGAVVMEAWSGKVAEAAHDTDLPSNLAYCMIITVEETLEMVGLIVCIHVMMRLLADRAVALSVDVVPDAEPKEVSGGAPPLHRAQQA